MLTVSQFLGSPRHPNAAVAAHPHVSCPDHPRHLHVSYPGCPPGFLLRGGRLLFHKSKGEVCHVSRQPRVHPSWSSGIRTQINCLQLLEKVLIQIMSPKRKKKSLSETPNANKNHGENLQPSWRCWYFSLVFFGVGCDGNLECFLFVKHGVSVAGFHL